MRVTGTRVRHRAMVLEAALALTAARAALALVPPRRLLRDAAAVATPPSAVPPPDARTLAGGRAVAAAIEGAARRLPWTSTCLVRALAGRFMLRRRHIACALHLGVAKPADRLEAHAWLTVGDLILTGGAQAPGFTPLARTD